LLATPSLSVLLGFQDAGALLVWFGCIIRNFSAVLMVNVLRKDARESRSLQFFLFASAH
jgi:hypothetical protein